MKTLSTKPYKGVRDFYPDDMAIQRYIFDVWSQTAEAFGFERYDASVLEPAELYRAKGAENEEMVNDQTYTFLDRGDREVTLRPEMTPTVARMIADRRKELSFPVRWYSIPNLFRYERTQRGRLREHWQLNCDIFGSNSKEADTEIVLLAYQILLNFGADPKNFTIHLNDKKEMSDWYKSIGITNINDQVEITRLNDRFRKITREDYLKSLKEIVTSNEIADAIFKKISGADDKNDQNPVVDRLIQLGVDNVVIDRSIARGFDYYTGTVFEIFDNSGENNRSMLGGGRYDNLTELFGGEPISGVGFGMGDVTMRDFLETHNLLTADITSPKLVIIPVSTKENISAMNLAQELRIAGISVAVDYSDKKLGKKISQAEDKMSTYIMVLGESEIKENKYTIKNLEDKTEISGTLKQLIKQLS